MMVYNQKTTGCDPNHPKDGGRMFLRNGIALNQRTVGHNSLKMEAAYSSESDIKPDVYTAQQEDGGSTSLRHVVTA
jgi:hypothetical protein